MGFRNVIMGHMPVRELHKYFLITFLSVSPALSWADSGGSDPEESAVATDLPLEAVPELDEEEERSGVDPRVVSHGSHGWKEDLG